MLPSIVTIPNDFVFLIEVIKSMFYFSMYFETFEVKLGLIHSAGLTIVSFVCLFLPYDCLRESLNI